MQVAPGRVGPHVSLFIGSRPDSFLGFSSHGGSMLWGCFLSEIRPREFWSEIPSISLLKGFQWRELGAHCCSVRCPRVSIRMWEGQGSSPKENGSLVRRRGQAIPSDILTTVTSLHFSTLLKTQTLNIVFVGKGGLKQIKIVLYL